MNDADGRAISNLILLAVLGIYFFYIWRKTR